MLTPNAPTPSSTTPGPATPSRSGDDTSAGRGPRPVAGLPRAYAVPAPGAPIDLWLAGNEGRAPVDLPSCDAAYLARYPSATELEAALATRFGVSPERVLVTAGADDGLLRIALAYVARGRVMVLPTPTFEMLPRYVGLAGGVLREVAWPSGPYPVDDVLACAQGAAAIAVVSPNNPTGATASRAALEAVARGAPAVLMVVDAAYAEFVDDADEDLTSAALALPNAVVLRTFSKAYGAAGLRVGYLLGPAPVIAHLRAAGNPYPVATPSLRYALAALQPDGQHALRANVEFVRGARTALATALRDLGFEVAPSAANFVLARLGARAREVAPGFDALLLHDLLAGLGIAVRAFAGRAGLDDALRITVPTTQGELERLLAALRTCLAPEALLFDMDGVLADVTRSYRAAILATAASFGAHVTAVDVQRAKDIGGANDDWALTRRLIEAAGIVRTLADVTARFEALYQGTEASPGLRATETLLAPRACFVELRARFLLAIVTGRPRHDALRFLREHGLEDLFDVLVAREDAPLKPDPAPVRLALTRLGVTRAWMIGDTPDDLRAARDAGVVPIGVSAEATSSAERVLVASGAARVLAVVTELTALLPPCPATRTSLTARTP
jgi:histidinol-phosphate aminotransferase